MKTITNLTGLTNKAQILFVFSFMVLITFSLIMLVSSIINNPVMIQNASF